MSLLILIGTVLVLEYILRAHPVPAARNVAPPLQLVDDDPGHHQAITSKLLDAAHSLDRQGRGPAPQDSGSGQILAPDASSPALKSR